MISLFLLNLINHALRSSRILIQSFIIFVIPPTGGSAGKESACNAGDLGSIPGLGRFPGEGKGYALQYFGLENSMDSPWVHKGSDTTEQLSLALISFGLNSDSSRLDYCSVNIHSLLFTS